MTRRRAPRRIGYPSRFVAQIIEAGIERKRRASPHLDSDAAVARWLGYKRGIMSSWLTGRTLPEKDEDWENLTRLPGVSIEELRAAALADRMYALMVDEDAEAQQLAITALKIWQADDQGAELSEILEQLAALGRHQAAR